MRWGEEVSLLLEEMRRVQMFLAWQADWWLSQETRRLEVGTALKEGLTAYARRQSHLRSALRSHFENQWSCVPAWIQWGEVPEVPELEDTEIGEA